MKGKKNLLPQNTSVFSMPYVKPPALSRKELAIDLVKSVLSADQFYLTRDIKKIVEVAYSLADEINKQGDKSPCE